MSDAREPRIVILKDGPYIVSGGVRITRQTIGTNDQGESVDWVEGEHFPDKQSCGLCRCGASKSKPYCDGSHAVAGFDGTETAADTVYEDAAILIEGPRVDLMDEVSRCAEARFCDRAGGTWNLVLQDDESAADLVIEEADLCPSGRYTARDKETGVPHEPALPQGIGIVSDPSAGCAGPIWVRGGIPIESSDGTVYEVRNRVTLCRCGKSGNKPFCDGTHVKVAFQDTP